MASVALTATNLGHAYGDVVALHHMDLEVPPGRVGLVGANGAGKTTFIKILLGILEPTVGSVSVLGADPAVDLITVRNRIGYMPEGECLPLAQSAADFVSLISMVAVSCFHPPTALTTRRSWLRYAKRERAPMSSSKQEAGS